MEKVLQTLREVVGDRAKEIMAILLGIDLIRERRTESFLRKLGRIVENTLTGVSGVEIRSRSGVIYSGGEKKGAAFDFNLGGGYGMRVYIESLDDDSLQLLEYVHMLSKDHLDLLRELETDPLTGAMTRRAGEERIREMIEGGRSFQLVFVDLDGLKEINDRFGHNAGDMYLRDFVRSARGAKLVVRWGGDEFVLVCEDTSSVIGEIERNFWGKFSYGVVKIPDEAKSLEEAIAKADERMYEMKRASHLLR